MKKLITFLCLTLALLLGGRPILIAQTTLSPGDVVILEFNGNGTDGFTFMPLINLDEVPKATTNTANMQLSPASAGEIGCNQAHQNIMPYIAMDYTVCINGFFPSGS
jgi:hypothetical protein